MFTHKKMVKIIHYPKSFVWILLLATLCLINPAGSVTRFIWPSQNLKSEFDMQIWQQNLAIPVNFLQVATKSGHSALQ